MMNKVTSIPYKTYKRLMIVIWFTIFQDLLCAMLFKFGIPGFMLKLVYYAKEAVIVFTGLCAIFSLLRSLHFSILKKEIIVAWIPFWHS